MLKEQKRKMKSQENNWNVKYCLNKWRQFGAKLELNSLKIISSISDEHQALLMGMLPARVPLAQNMVQMSSATAWFWIIWWRHASVQTWTWQSNHHTQLCFFPTNGAQIKSGFQASCVNVAPGGTSPLHLEHFNTSHNSKIKRVLSLMAAPSQNHNPLRLFPGQICTFQQREKKKKGEKKKSNVTVTSLKGHLLL